MIDIFINRWYASTSSVEVIRYLKIVYIVIQRLPISVPLTAIKSFTCYDVQVLHMHHKNADLYPWQLEHDYYQIIINSS